MALVKYTVEIEIDTDKLEEIHDTDLSESRVILEDAIRDELTSQVGGITVTGLRFIESSDPKYTFQSSGQPEGIVDRKDYDHYKCPICGSDEFHTSQCTTYGVVIEGQ